MKKFTLSLIITAITALSANANIDTNYTTTEQYFLNSGYSSNMGKYAKLLTRDPYGPTDEIYKNDGLTIWKRIWKKVDPTAFEDENATWHDIKMETRLSDF